MGESQRTIAVRMDIERNVVLLTGGSRGIGAATVRAFHAAGARVTFTYVRDEAAARALVVELGPERIACERIDVGDPDALPGLVERCVARYGRLDTLVNNAAVFADNPFDRDDYAAWRANWERTFAVNVSGAANLAFLGMRAMRRNKPDARGTRGRIINIASRAAHRGELTFADYGASKAALVNLGKSIARGCAADGIVAFSVAPGFIATEMATDAIATYGAAIRAEIPSGRIGTPDDVAPTVVFLASGAADYATGQTIDLNGASYVR
jgi:NAD(P)-dependent dehydrogenase (short-subunit alcohol dehydrogenase family)